MKYHEFFQFDLTIKWANNKDMLIKGIAHASEEILDTTNIPKSLYKKYKIGIFRPENRPITTKL